MEFDSLFIGLVIVVVFLALVLQFVPLILNALLRRSEEQRIERILREQGATGTKPADLSKAFESIKAGTGPTPVTRTTLSVLPIIVVAIAILYLILANRDILLVSANNTTVNSTITTAVTATNSLINTLLGVLAGFLTAAAGFYFGSRATATQPSSEIETTDVSEQLKTLSELHDEQKLTDDEYNALKKKLI